MAGLNNAVSKGYIEYNVMTELLIDLAKTNVIFVTVPYWNSRPVLNNLIFNINKLFYKLSDSHNNLKVLDLNVFLGHRHFIKQTGSINYQGKLIVGNNLAQTISSWLNSKLNQNQQYHRGGRWNNLIYITPTNNLIHAPCFKR